MSLDYSDFNVDIAGPDLELAQGLPDLDLRQYAILLDIDGTILDLAPSPQQVQVPANLRQTLERLRELTGGALALVSGRTLANIDLIFAPLKLAAIGGHGAEWRAAPGAQASSRTQPLDAELKRKLAAVCDLGPGVIVEDKGYSFALHYRQAPDQAEAVRAAVAAICAEAKAGTIEVLLGKSVVEIKAAGISKANAVRDLMAVAPFAKRKPVFIGDDITDEPVFAVVTQFGGLGFSVGHVDAAVNGRFATPQSVRRWLAQLASSRGSKE